MNSKFEEVSSGIRCFLAEFVGTAFFLFVVTVGVSGLIMSPESVDGAGFLLPAAVLSMATVIGIGLASSIYLVGAVSGGHLNPAVSFAMIITRNISLLKGLGYILSQAAGSIVGSAIAYGTVGTEYFKGDLMVAPSSTVRQSLVAEIVGTFLLVSVVFSAAVQTTIGIQTPSKINVRSFTPYIAGITVWVLNIGLIPIDGCAVNPARALGPAIMAGNYDSHWIFWVGPAIGAVCAAVLQLLLYGQVLGEDLEEKDEVLSSARLTDPRALV